MEPQGKKCNDERACPACYSGQGECQSASEDPNLAKAMRDVAWRADGDSPEAHAWAALREAYMYGQFADDATWQMPKPVRQAIITLLDIKATARPADDKLWEDSLSDRDAYHEWADKLAAAIAQHFEVDIGEHSNMNNPWENALEAIEPIAPPVTAGRKGKLPDVARTLAGQRVYSLGYARGREKGRADVVKHAAKYAAPIPLVLHCPQCHTQHIDAPKACSYTECRQAGMCYCAGMGEPERCDQWTNPPHRSHKCQSCGCVWRPSDVATTGVHKIESAGEADTWKP